MIGERHEKTIYPWQVTPTELIKKAIELLSHDAESDRQIAYLLIDVGVETMLKTFLLLPKSVTGVELSYNKKVDATESNFHNLVETTKLAGEHRLAGINLDEVKYYHSIRNKLYHQGDGVIPTSDNSYKYATLAVELLDRLLSVDLHPLLLKEQQYQKRVESRIALVAQKLLPIKQELKSIVTEQRGQLISKLEEEGDELAKKSFADEMEDYINRMSQPEHRRWKSGIRRLINEFCLYILDDEDHPVESISWDYGDDNVVEFLEGIVEVSPAGAAPKRLIEYLEESTLGYAEYDVAEILTADDFMEVLLLLVGLYGYSDQFIPIGDYREIRRILNWDYDVTLTDEEFDNRLNEIVERGKQFLNKLSYLSTDN